MWDGVPSMPWACVLQLCGARAHHCMVPSSEIVVEPYICACVNTETLFLVLTDVCADETRSQLTCSMH